MTQTAVPKENGNKKEYKEFQRLLKKGIGARTQADFAEQTGITKYHLNRMLNAKLISQPNRSTLATLAKYLANVSYEELLIACDYDVPPIEERAKAAEKEITEYFNDISGKISMIPIKEMCDTMEMLYLTDCSDTHFAILNEEGLSDNEDVNGADLKRGITMHWGSNPNRSCETSFTLYYTKTSSSCIVPIKISEPKTKIKLLTEEDIKNRRGAAKLLANIFGSVSPVTYIGPGLKYDGIPKNFKKFLMNHAGSFCTSKERAALYREAIKEDSDVEKVFEKFEDVAGGMGAGAVIAVILSEEMKDIKDGDENLDHFYYWEKEERLDEAARTSFIMQARIDNSDEPVPDRALLKLYEYAKELEIEEFGLCYHHDIIFEDTLHTYKTKTFAVSFRD